MKVYLMTVLASLLALSAANVASHTNLEGLLATLITISYTNSIITGTVKRFQTIYPQVLHKTRPTRSVRGLDVDFEYLDR